MARYCVLAFAAVIAVLATAPGAPAATGTARFTAAPYAGPATQAAHLHFRLAPGYKQLVGALGGNPLMGVFRRTRTLASGNDCVDDLAASGRARRIPPDRRGDVLQLVRGQDTPQGPPSKYLRILSSGHTSTLRWYIGPTWSWPRTSPSASDPELTAVAVMRAPTRFASTGTNWAVLRISLTSSCRTTRAARIVELQRAIRAGLILPGRVHAAPGVASETA